jgi:thiol-disulfide isomerase/thioredoxin
MRVCIALLLSLTSLVAFSQIKVVHFNAGWNEANDVEWFNKLSDAGKKSLSIDDAEIQKKYAIAIVPTIIIFDDGEEVKRFQADLSFKMVATREEIQEYIDELIISKF